MTLTWNNPEDLRVFGAPFYYSKMGRVNRCFHLCCIFAQAIALSIFHV